MHLIFKPTEPILALCYEITHEGKNFAKLEFQYSRIRNYATATIEGEQFEIGGWLLVNTDVKIKNLKSGKVIANYYSRAMSFKGKLKIGDKEYSFVRKDINKTEYSWISNDGKEMIHYLVKGFMQNNGEIQISSEMEKDPNLKMLVVVGLYQIMLNGLWQVNQHNTSKLFLYVLLIVIALVLVVVSMFTSLNFNIFIDFIQNIGKEINYELLIRNS